MERIIRLSWANIKKHKLESVSLVILVILCMMLTGSSLAGSVSIREIFPQLMERTECYDNVILIESRNYDREFENILRQNDAVEDVQRFEVTGSMNTSFLNVRGEEQALFMLFITMDDDQKLERPQIETTLTDAEIAALEHPIYMPVAATLSMGCHAGDSFTMIYGMRKFTFTIAGFYDTSVFDQSSYGLKMIVGDEDYHILESILTKYTALAYNDHHGAGGDDMIEQFLKGCQNYANCDILSTAIVFTYEGRRLTVTTMTDLLLKIIIGMAAIIILAVAVMIRFRVKTDIQDQIVNIGVLEALGYTSRDITLSYMLEYALLAAAGVMLGIGGCFLLTPGLLLAGEYMSGHRVASSIAPLPIVLTAAGILVFVALIAFIRARMVRNYPPVRAFRKGQGDHRFGKEYFPLRDTGKSVHLRLAMKGFVQNFRQNLGLTLCILVASAAILFSFIMFSYFSNGYESISAISGMEISDLRVSIMPFADARAFADELLLMPEVRKATPTSSENNMVMLADHNEYLYPMAFDSFDVTENIFPMDGRFPEHDNEIMVTNMLARHYHVHVGDTLTLSSLNVKRRYLVSGIVTSATNGGINLYITTEGLERLIPTYRPDLVEIYLQDGINPNEFRHMLTEKYGRSISDVAQDSVVNGSYEERIRAEAEKQIAEMMANDGATHVEYAIQVGDTIITGNSDSFLISGIMNIGDIIRTQLSGISTAVSAITTLFIILSAVVVMIILFILMESTIRRQRKEFGIMKGMGYTSKELMVQLACRIMPAALVSVALGTAAAVAASKLLTGYFGKVPVNIPMVLVMDIVLLLFCFACAYFGARKIKTISVYELMTE